MVDNLLKQASPSSIRNTTSSNLTKPYPPEVREGNITEAFEESLAIILPTFIWMIKVGYDNLIRIPNDLRLLSQPFAYLTLRLLGFLRH